jgi:hypothetical protein
MNASKRGMITAVTVAMLAVLSPGVAEADAAQERFEVTDLAAWRGGSDETAFDVARIAEWRGGSDVAFDVTRIAEWRGELTDPAPVAGIGDGAIRATADTSPAVHPIWWAIAGVVLGALAALGVAGRRPQRAVAG